MTIERVIIKNYRALQSTDVKFSDNLSIIVGDNESGKSTVLEAINLAHRGRLGPHPPGQRQGRVLLPADGRARHDTAPQRAHHQHRLDRGQGLRRHLECGLRRQQGRRHRPNENRRATLGRHNINVNSVCPGVTRTALSDANLRVRAEQEGLSLEAMEARRAEVIPLGRANDPADIAALVVFLATPGARNITGQSYNVDGGIVPD